MLQIPDSEFIYRLLSIDNGTNTFGTAVIDLDLRTGLMHLVNAETITAERQLWTWNGVVQVHGELFARYQVLQRAVTMLLDLYAPHGLAVETAFFKRGRVNSFARLSEMIALINQVVFDYDPLLIVEGISPKAAKLSVNADRFTGNAKEIARQGVLALPNLTTAHGIVLEELDEHSIDAIAVGVAYGQLVRRRAGFI